VASLLLAWTSLHDTRFPRRAAGGWLVLALVLIAWVSIMQWGPAPTTDEWLTIPVTMQKIVAVAIVVVFFYEMHEVDRVVTGVRESAV
jgi:sterol desaturase/sphingolipid hydroxylase (fatty acid hydroxylase superfamily)